MTKKKSYLTSFEFYKQLEFFVEKNKNTLKNTECKKIGNHWSIYCSNPSEVINSLNKNNVMIKGLTYGRIVRR